MQKIDGPNSNGGTYAVGINTDGVVVGYYLTRPNRNKPYKYYGFTWTP